MSNEIITTENVTYIAVTVFLYVCLTGAVFTDYGLLGLT